ncbi:MAG: branched-chain amino acid ABC transporter permease [Spirochaetae bacterium HGW-Spirochaetae-3]|nr:MAG: branched-chain amino acid ABC transporter permease [Spirochaetae bacterium HGW-Spirochaetae-3]
MKDQSSPNTKRSVLGAAFKAGIPVLLGYSSIGFAFGLVLVGSGLPWWLSPLMAVIVYAGAAQFMGAGLLAAGSGVIEIAILTLLMNARHAVYGLSVLDKYAAAGRRKPYLVFGLTDETYGLITTMEPPPGVDMTDFYVALTAMNQCWWVLGCTAGALFGKALPFDTTGLDFAMTALFVVLLVEQTKAIRRPEPYLAAITASALAYAIVGSGNFILVATALTCGFLLIVRDRLERGGPPSGTAGQEALP